MLVGAGVTALSRGRFANEAQLAEVAEIFSAVVGGTALKGGAFDKLISRTADGLAVQPLYPPARGDRAATRGAAK